MGVRTKTPPVDSTLNLVIGCSRKCEVGAGCFAERLCRRFAGKNPGFPKDFSKPVYGETEGYARLSGGKHINHPAGGDPSEFPPNLQGCREVPKP